MTMSQEPMGWIYGSALRNPPTIEPLKTAIPRVSTIITRPIPRAKSKNCPMDVKMLVPATLTPRTAKKMGRVQLNEAVP